MFCQYKIGARGECAETARDRFSTKPVNPPAPIDRGFCWGTALTPVFPLLSNWTFSLLLLSLVLRFCLLCSAARTFPFFPLRDWICPAICCHPFAPFFLLPTSNIPFFPHPPQGTWESHSRRPLSPGILSPGVNKPFFFSDRRKGIWGVGRGKGPRD